MDENALKFGVWGITDFQRVKDHLNPSAGGKDRLNGVKSLICVAFPYFSGMLEGDISLYARGRDYHAVIGEILENICSNFRESFPGFTFEKYVDIDPINEVYAAACAGIGVIGENGLLICDVWGSYVFLGIIATDAELGKGVKPKKCKKCGACKAACPVGLDKSRCLSYITQKRGELTEEEQRLAAGHSLIWGCDICQLSCPMNKDVETTDIADFKEDLTCFFPKEDISLSDRKFREKYKDKAFAWRGIAPIRRNIKLRRQSMNIKIRQATPEDLEAVVKIESVCYPQGEAATRKSLEKRLAAYKTCYFVAEKDGEIVGHINGSIVHGNDIYDELYENIALHDENEQWQGVFGLGVLPEYRRQGIAEQMMNTLINTAKKAGRKGLFLDCKDHLVHYYAKFGYEKVGLSKSVLGGATWYDMVLTF